MNRAHVVGGGITGLVTSFYLQKKGYIVHLYEKENSLGGLVKTIQLTSGRVDRAANGFIGTPELFEVCDAIGIQLLPANNLSKKKYFFINSRMTRWPLSVFESLCFLFNLLTSLVLNRFPPSDAENLKNWGARTLGEAFTEKVLRIAVLGIYAGKIEELSANLIVGRFFKNKKNLDPHLISLKQKYRHLLRKTVTPKNGMTDFVDALSQYLIKMGVQIHLDHPFEIEKLEGNIFICTNALDCKQILTPIVSVDSEVAKSLSSLKLPAVTSVICEVSNFISKSGFGCLFHPNEKNVNTLGVLWNHNIFPHRVNQKCLTFIYSELKVQNLIEKTDKQIHDIVLSDLKVISPDASIKNLTINRWKNGFPYYDLALERAVKNLNSALPIQTHAKNVWVNGNYLGGLGLSQIISRTRELVFKTIDNQVEAQK